MESLRTNVNQVCSDFRDIKDAIVSSGVEVADGTKTSEYAGKVSEVYEKSRLDTWNKITNYNTRIFYTNAYWGMPDGSFDPPFALRPVNAEGMFREVKQKKITTEQLDLSACENFPYGFYGTQLEELGVIDIRKNNNLTAMFYASGKLHTIEKLIIADDGSTKTNATLLFSSTPALENISVEGKFGVSTSFSYSPKLSYESLMGEKGIVNALIDLKGTGETATLTLHTDAKARLSDAEKAIIAQKGWTLA